LRVVQPAPCPAKTGCTPAREQRCCVHKTAKVLNKLPKGMRAKAKQHLQAIWMAETREATEAAFDYFLEAHGAKYDRAAGCLAKDRDALLTFFMPSRPSTGSPSGRRMRSTKAFCSAVVCWCGTGDRVAKSGAAAASSAGLPDPMSRPQCGARARVGWLGS
jgi:Transposase, Mutator family